MKKITALILSVSLLSGCMGSGSDSESQSLAPAVEIPKAETLFQCEELTQPDENITLESIQYEEGRLYVLQTSYDTSGGAVTSIYTYDEKGKGERLFDFSPDSQNAGVKDFCILPDGSFALSVQSGYNPDMNPDNESLDFDWSAYWAGYIYTHTLETFSRDGTRLDSVETDCSGGVRANETGQLILLGNNGTGDNLSQMIEESGQVTDIPELKTDLLLDFEKDADGNLLILCIDGLRKWNRASCTFEAVTLSSNHIYFTGIIPGVTEENPYYLTSGDGIYAVSPEGTLSQTVSFTDSGITLTEGSFMVCTGEDTFAGIMRSSTGGTYLGKISPRTEDNTQEVKILTLGCYYVDNVISDMVSEFNRSRKDCRIQIIDYSEYDENFGTDQNEYKGILKMNEDIAAGKAPDIYVLNMSEFHLMSETESFLDLYEVMGTNGTFTKNDFLPNYLTAMEENGALYWISSYFSISTQIANLNMSGGRDSWTVQEFVDISRELEAQGVHMIESQTKERYMDVITAGNPFVDYDKGVCYYDDPAFLDALKFAEEMEEFFYPDYECMTQDEILLYNMERSAECKNGTRMLYNNWLVALNEYIMWLAMYGDNPAGLIGNPTLDGSSGHYFEILNQQFAISSACSEPEIAWEFINTQLNVNPEIVIGFPVVDELLREMLQFDMEEMNSLDYIGGTCGVEIKYPKITQEDVDFMYEFILSLEEFPEHHAPVTEIYEDVMQGFYDSTKTAEETAEELQERVSLYLLENQ